jgi:hypothetical protein
VGEEILVVESLVRVTKLTKSGEIGSDLVKLETKSAYVSLYVVNSVTDPGVDEFIGV